jgi:hypothetical protein
MGNRVQERRDFPSHVVEVVPPVEEVESVVGLEQDCSEGSHEVYGILEGFLPERSGEPSTSICIEIGFADRTVRR